MNLTYVTPFLSVYFCNILRSYQRALQVLNDRFCNVEHALQVITCLNVLPACSPRLQVRCDQQIRAAVAAVRRTICDVQIKEEVVVKKVKKDEALANYKLQISNLLQTESRIRRLFRDIEQVCQGYVCCQLLSHTVGR